MIVLNLFRLRPKLKIWNQMRACYIPHQIIRVASFYEAISLVCSTQFVPWHKESVNVEDEHSFVHRSNCTKLPLKKPLRVLDILDKI